MAKKVKCLNCWEFMNWSLPQKINSGNLDYAKQCLNLAKKTGVCGYTMKTKSRNNEQYCKHYSRTSYSNDNTKQIKELEVNIKMFETRCSNGEM